MGGLKDKFPIRGHVTYQITPMQQKLFKGFWGNILPEISKRVQEQWKFILPPFLAGYGIYKYAWWKYHKMEEEVQT